METERTCKECGETKPISEFYAQSKRRKDGELIYRASCKKCVDGKQWEAIKNDPAKLEAKQQRINQWLKETGYTAKVYRKKNPLLVLTCVCGKEFKQKSRKQKYCSRACGTRQSSKAYYNRKGKKKNTPSSSSEKICKECGETKPKTEFSKRPSGKICNECLPSYNAQQHRKHKDYYQGKNRERVIKLRGVSGTHTKLEWAQVKASQNYKCLCCGRSEPDIELTKDHVIPLAKGGTDNIENIQGLCRNCNSKKAVQEIDYRMQS